MWYFTKYSLCTHTKICENMNSVLTSIWKLLWALNFSYYNMAFVQLLYKHLHMFYVECDICTMFLFVCFLLLLFFIPECIYAISSIICQYIEARGKQCSWNNILSVISYSLSVFLSILVAFINEHKMWVTSLKKDALWLVSLNLNWCNQIPNMNIFYRIFDLIFFLSFFLAC